MWTEYTCLCLSAKDSFNPSVFFKTIGLSKKTPAEIEKVFKILDQDKSGYIEQDELQLSAESFPTVACSVASLFAYETQRIGSSSGCSCKTSPKERGLWLQLRPELFWWRETQTGMERSAGKVGRAGLVGAFYLFLYWIVLHLCHGGFTLHTGASYHHRHHHLLLLILSSLLIITIIIILLLL